MNQTPSKARYIVTAFAISLAVITYIDRVGISVALPLIRDELKLSPIQMGWALAAFAWAYAVFEIPGGWLGDRIGPRRVLMRIVIWWSFFTAATGWVWNPSSLIVTRALFGAGEAGAFPNLTRVLTTWLPVKERERAQAFLWLATRVSGAFTPLLVAMLISAIRGGARSSSSACIGVIWAVLFYRWYRDDSERTPEREAAELALLPPAQRHGRRATGVPWGVIFSNPTSGCSRIQYMCLAYGWWFYINWLPTYLREARGTSVKSARCSPACRCCSAASAAWCRRALVAAPDERIGSVSMARRIIAIIGFVGASAYLRVHADRRIRCRRCSCSGMAGFFNDFVMPAAWAGCMDIGGRYAGTVSGAMNMMGSIAGALSVLVVGYLLAWSPGTGR